MRLEEDRKGAQRGRVLIISCYYQLPQSLLFQDRCVSFNNGDMNNGYFRLRLHARTFTNHRRMIFALAE